MPITPQNRGTNRDETLNEDYCIYCFKDGEFTNHSLTMHDMELRIMEMAKVHNELNLEEAESLIKKLPDLKRWRINAIL